MKTNEISKSFKKTQNQIIKAIKTLDSTIIKKSSAWKHRTGGGGISCEMEGSKYIDKAAVNFSSIVGDKLPASALQKSGVSGLNKYRATGVSVIIHPANPKIPCAHMNIRFFEAKVNKKNVWWFGGGFDLTPYFINKSDIHYWKNSAKELCDKYKRGMYEEYNKNCNNYFFLPHRQEPRGVGGLFYDQMNSPDYSTCKEFSLDCANTFKNSYLYLFDLKKNKKYTKKEKSFQLYRRGRYVEFNLLYDRGTLFGLQSGGRAESILMSLPPEVTWNKKYDFTKYEKNLMEMFSLARK